MLKTRLIGVVLVRHGIAVQSIRFERFLPIGTPEIALKYLDRWGIDEVVLLHLDGATSGVSAKADEVRCYARQGQIPLSVGGGIRSIDDVKRIIHSGADKVVLNTALLMQPGFVAESATLFGNQCIMASIDARKVAEGRYEAFVRGGSCATGLTAAELAARGESLGAGEIFLTSIDRDGAKQGYDLALIASVRRAVGLPVIACGGAGHPAHMAAAMAAGASAVAAGNMLHFSEHSVITAKRQLIAEGSSLRLDSYVSYEGFAFGADGRAAKLADEYLDHLRFRYIPEEII